MNSAAYIFSNDGTYSQYPDDYAKEIFQKMAENASGESTVAIHRENNLMYYVYIHRTCKEYYYLNDPHSGYFGFCIILNDLMLTDIKGLFSIFEDATNRLIGDGKILYKNREGDLCNSDLNFYQKEAADIIAYLNSRILELEATAKKLPPLSYSIANTEMKKFSIDDDPTETVESSAKYAYTFITKEAKKETKGNTTKKQQKANRWHYFFYPAAIIIIAILSGNLYMAYDELDERPYYTIYRDKPVYHEDTIAIMRAVAAENELSNLRAMLSEGKPMLMITDINLSKVDGRIESPYGTTKTYYNSDPRFINPKIRYKGIAPGYVTLDIWLDFFHFYSERIYVSRGNRTVTLPGLKVYLQNNWKDFQGTFTDIELYNNGILVGSSSFYVKND